MKYSGIGGQALLEGVMMKNKDTYAVAVRLSNGDITVETSEYKGIMRGGIWSKVPIVRGVLNFIDSMVLGIKTLMYSATFFDEEEEAEWEREKQEKERKKAQKKAVKEAKRKGEDPVRAAEEAAKAYNAAAGIGDTAAGKDDSAAGKDDTAAGMRDAAIARGSAAAGKGDAAAGRDDSGSMLQQAGAIEAARAEASGKAVDPKAAARASVQADRDALSGKQEEKTANGHEVSAGDKAIMGTTTVIAFVIAIAIFVILPYYLSQALQRVVDSQTIITIFEGVLRLVIFVAYVAVISKSEDIHRTYMYHGAEHKCINCIEHGLDLTVENVRGSSKEHKRCGTSFMMFVVVICIILYLFIRVDSHTLRIVIRLLLVPVIAGISYEILRAAGRTDNWFINLISRPGLWLQHLTTKEPDDSMIEVGIASVEAVFDWRSYVEEVRTEEAVEAAKAEACAKAAKTEAVAKAAKAAKTAEATGAGPSAGRAQTVKAESKGS